MKTRFFPFNETKDKVHSIKAHFLNIEVISNIEVKYRFQYRSQISNNLPSTKLVNILYAPPPPNYDCLMISDIKKYKVL